jgi:hypothetical protein
MINERDNVIISGRVILKFATRVLIVIDRERLAKVYIEPGLSHDGHDAVYLSWLYFNDIREWSVLLPAISGDDSYAARIFDSIIEEAGDVIWRESKATKPATWERGHLVPIKPA